MPQGSLDQFNHPLTSLARIGFAAVDGFFVLSGLLIGHATFGRQLDKSKPLVVAPRSVLSVWWRRWARIAPPYYVVLALYCRVVFPDGLYPLENCRQESTRKTWVTHFDDPAMVPNLCEFVPANLLFLNNFFPGGGTAGWTWSLAVTVQFYFWWPLLLKVVQSFASNAEAALKWVAMLFCAATVAIRAGLLAQIILNMPRSDERDYFMFLVYSNSFCRAGALVCGAMISWASTRGRLGDWLRSGRLRALGWLVVAVTVAVNCYEVDLPDMGFSTDARWLYVYNVGFGAGSPFMVASFVFILGALTAVAADDAKHQRGVDEDWDIGVLRGCLKVLSWKWWQPVARLSFLGYLLHPVVSEWPAAARSAWRY